MVFTICFEGGEKNRISATKWHQSEKRNSGIEHSSKTEGNQGDYLVCADGA